MDNSKVSTESFGFRKARFPIRLKIVLTLLTLISAAFVAITWTMGNLFHNDKKAYIRDLNSLIAIHTAQEANAILSSYIETLSSFAYLIHDREVSQKNKVRLLNRMFEDFDDFISITLTEKERSDVSVYDANILSSFNLTQKDISNYRNQNPLPLDDIFNGNIFIENSSISNNLPTIILALKFDFPQSKKPIVISALIKSDKLLKLAGRSEVYETFLVDKNGIPIAHGSTNIIMKRERPNWLPEMSSFSQIYGSATIKDYQYEGADYVGGFSPVGIGGLMSAVHLPKSAAYLTTKDLIIDLVVVSVVLLLISAFSGLLWAWQISRPISQLVKATKVIGQGNFQITIKAKTKDEMGLLSDSFNTMAKELLTREEELHKAQVQLIQSEKMSVFGNLSAGIAHEVKNPLAGIICYAQLTLNELEKESQAYKNVSVIEKETKRCSAIIDNLMKFARQQNETEMESVDINQVINNATAIVNHQMMINQIDLQTNLSSDLPLALGNANQLQQVLINLLINAQQAMDDSPGKVQVSTQALRDDIIEIQISDSGPGMSDEVKNHIFEPFFTTKPSGKGTGLGMSVSYGIIKDHNGEITVTSELGHGATFSIRIPTFNDNTKASSMSKLKLEDESKSING